MCLCLSSRGDQATCTILSEYQPCLFDPHYAGALAISMAWRKTTVYPVCSQWRYCSLALSHQCEVTSRCRPPMISMWLQMTWRQNGARASASIIHIPSLRINTSEMKSHHDVDRQMSTWWLQMSWCYCGVRTSVVKMTKWLTSDGWKFIKIKRLTFEWYCASRWYSHWFLHIYVILSTKSTSL